jgi:hypothetical protein
MKKYIIMLLIFISPELFSQDLMEYKVKEGDTLSKISKDHLSDPRKWRELLQYNKIDTPDRIKPGLVLKIPAYLAKNQETKIEAIAKLEFKVGEVKFKRDKASDWTDTNAKQEFVNNDIIRTMQKASAQIRFIKQPQALVQIKENSIMKIEESDKQKTVSMDSGELIIKVFNNDKSNKDVKLNLKTATSVAGVRGTEFNVATDSEGNDKYGCLEGLMDVTAQGVTVQVPAGFGTTVKKGEAPIKPFKLLEKVMIKPIVK